MPNLTNPYSIASRLTAALLVVAGSLKFHEVVTGTPTLGKSAMATFELLFGAWLLLGLYPRWSRIVALICFIVFLNASLAQALEGQASCRCFGKVSVQPWTAVMLDSVVLAALLCCSPMRHGNPAPHHVRARWVAFCGMALTVALLIGWPLVREVAPAVKAAVWPPVAPDDPTGMDANALSQVLQGLDRNRSAVQRAVCTLDMTMVEHPVKFKWNVPVWGGGTVPPPEPVERTYRSTLKCYVRGDELRCDSNCRVDPTGDEKRSREILVGSKGKRIQYMPGLNKAWISTSTVVDAGRTEAVDPRCFGFHSPISTIAEWLRESRVIAVGRTRGRTGLEVVRAHVSVGQEAEKADVMVDFEPEMSYMPCRVVYRFTPDLSVWSVSDIEYAATGTGRAWFPKTVRTRYFWRGTTSDPDAESGQNLSTEYKVREVTVGVDIPDDTFDPVLPRSTQVVGDLARPVPEGKTSVRASAVTRTDPLQPTPPSPPPARGMRWLVLTCVDAVLLGCCVLYRHRFAF